MPKKNNSAAVPHSLPRIGDLAFSLNRLRQFIAIVDARSVSAAATQLGVGQPTLSRYLDELDQVMGSTVYSRSKNGGEPTPIGRILYSEAVKLIAQSDRFHAAIESGIKGEIGMVSVGYTSSAALNVQVPFIIKQFREKNPRVGLQLEEGNTHQLAKALRMGRLDVAFIRTDLQNDDQFEIIEVLEERMVVALPLRHHLFVGGGEPIHLSKLKDEPFILYGRGAAPGLYEIIEKACLLEGFSPNLIQEVPRLPATISLVAAGLGVTIVPASIRSMALEGVKYVELDESTPIKAKLYLATSRGNVSQTVRLFLALVRETAKHYSESTY